MIFINFSNQLIALFRAKPLNQHNYRIVAASPYPALKATKGRKHMVLVGKDVLCVMGRAIRNCEEDAMRFLRGTPSHLNSKRRASQ